MKLTTRSAGISFALAIIALVIASGAVAGVASAGRAGTASTVTYSVDFQEVGLPAGTSWSITLDSTTVSSTSASITFSSVSGATYHYWTAPSSIPSPTYYGVEYTPTIASGSMDVPSQITQYVIFQTQYLVSATSTSPSEATVSPYSPTYYPAGSDATLLAYPQPGYTGLSWSWVNSAGPGGTTTKQLAVGNSLDLKIGDPTNITLAPKATSFRLEFNETGLPASTSWSVNLSGTSHSSTASLLGPLLEPAGYYSYTVPTVVTAPGVEYVAASTLGYLYPPYLTSAAIVFVPEVLFNLTVGPTFSSGYTTPYSAVYEPTGVAVPIAATSYSNTNFTNWSSHAFVGSGNPVSFSNGLTSDGNVVEATAPADIIANFTAGTPCSTKCTVTLDEVGIPVVGKFTSVAWGLTINGSFLGSTAAGMRITGVNASDFSGSWSVASPIFSGTPGVYYVASPSGGYLDLPYQSVLVVNFVEEDSVSFSVIPANTGAYVTQPSGLFPYGSTISVSTWGALDYGFSSWTKSVVAHFGLSNGASASTSIQILGPGWVNATLRPLTHSFTFTQTGLKSGTVWGVSLGSVSYYSNGTTGTTSSIIIPSVPDGQYSWTVITPLLALGPYSGSEYVDTTPYGSVNSQLDSGQAVNFIQEFLVKIGTKGTVGGSVSPTGSSYYPKGSTIALSAINGTSVSFVSWTSSSVGNAPANPAAASTYFVVASTGTTLAKFT